MHKAFLVLIVIFGPGCATTGRYDCSRPTWVGRTFGSNQRTETYKACIANGTKAMSEKRDAESKAEAEEQAKKDKAYAEWQAKADEASKLGTPKEKFDQVFRKPDRQELYNGDIVYWYDESEPFFVVFKNDKLNSIFTDTETMNIRAQNKIAADQRREADVQEKRNRIQQGLAAAAMAIQAQQIQQNHRQLNRIDDQLHHQRQQLNQIQSRQNGGRPSVAMPGY